MTTFLSHKNVKIRNQAVKGEILGDVTVKGTPNIRKFSFYSHDACKEKHAYPYYVYYWGSMIYHFGMLRLNNETFLHKKNLFRLALGKENFNSFTLGSGVLFENENRYFIRGIANRQVEVEKDDDFNTFMKNVRSEANVSLAEKSEALSQSIRNGSISCDMLDNELFPNMFTDLLKTSPKEEENRSSSLQNLVGVIDVANYVDWIKQVRDLID